jgi:tryptophan synthase alpha chain
MALEKYIREQLGKKEILLMTHIVLGYPSLDDSYRIIKAMVEAGVDIMELQIPFSEPTADGPIIVKANQHAIDNGTTVEACMQLAGKAAKKFEIPFLIMTYYMCALQIWH